MTMEKINLNIESCSGCHACVSVCPKNCIVMTEDKLGFLRPSIDKSLCIQCGLCVRTCNKTKQIS